MNIKVKNYIHKVTLKFELTIKERWVTVPIAEILSGKNARAWVSMVLYLKKWNFRPLIQRSLM